MHVATKRLYGHAHFSYSCMHVATKRLYGPAIFSRQDAVVIHASVQTSLIREAPACRHRPSAIVHQKLLFLFTCFIRFCTCFMHVLCAFIFVFFTCFMHVWCAFIYFLPPWIFPCHGWRCYGSARHLCNLMRTHQSNRTLAMSV